MATRAEQFKAEQERKKHNRKPNGGHLSAGIRVARSGRRKDRYPNPTSHNEGGALPRDDRRFALELDLTSRPPRKMTRISPAHEKTDSPLRIRTMIRNASPGERSARR